MHNVNKQLLELYTSKWSELCTAIAPIFDNNALEIKPTNPLLLLVDDEADLCNADIRIMFFGQETNDWEPPQYSDKNNGVEMIRSVYNDFYNSGACFKYGGYFWNAIAKFHTKLENKYPGKKIRLVWNNIVKIGKASDKGCPPDYIYAKERECFSVVKDEMNIIKPNVLLFFTGPNYDSKMTDVFGKISHSAIFPFTERELSSVSLPGINADAVIRTYHPGYLHFKGVERYLDTIVSCI